VAGAHQQKVFPSGRNGSVRVDALRLSPRWWSTPHRVPIPGVALHTALQSLFHRFFSHGWSRILNEHSGIRANCEHTLESIHWVHACICIAMRWVTLRKISPRVHSTCAQNAILSLLTVHIIPSRQIYVPVDNPSLILSVSYLTTSSGLWNYVHPASNVSHNEKRKAMAAGAFLTGTNFPTGSTFHRFSGIVVSARANQYSTTAPSSFWRSTLNSCCSCHRRRPFCAPLLRGCIP
jgi:hypothetical protein